MHALISTINGNVYSVGDNTYGELGFSREITYKQNPSIIPFFRNLKVIDLAAGARHSLILEENGKIYAFGDNCEFQCGIDQMRTYEPIEIDTQ